VTVSFLFPTPVSIRSIDNFPIHKEDLIEWCYKFREKNPNSDNSIFRSSWQSEDKRVFDDQDFSEFINFISNQISSSLECFNLTISEMSLESMWINFQPTYGYSVRTKEKNSSYTGILWLKVEKGNGNLVFENELNHETISFYSDEFCQNNNIFERYSIMPEEGKVVMFPSNIPYYFDQNIGNSEIISLGFNLNVR
jgi:hypothetical protein